MSALLFLTVAAFAQESEAEPAPLDPYLYAQVWATVYDQDQDAQADPTGYGDPEDDPGFKLRRLRAGVTGEVDDFEYGFILGLSAPADAFSASGELAVLDAFGGWNPVELVNVRVGLQRVPFSREQLMSSRQLVFQERAVASNHLVPAREIGAQVDGALDMGLRLRAGVFNGNGDILGDDDPGLLYGARLEYTLGEERDAYRTWGVVDGLVVGAAGDFYLNDQLATRTLAYGGDVILRFNGLAVLGEFHINDIAPTNTDLATPGVLTDTRRVGWYGQVGYSVGTFEPAIRFESFDDDTSSTDNGDLTIATVGVTSHLKDDRIRVGGGYVMRMEPAEVAFSNDTARLWFQVMY